MNKKNYITYGSVVLGVGIVMAIHGYNRSRTLEGSLMLMAGELPPGGGEYALGAVIGVVGLIMLIVGAFKKTVSGAPK